MSNCHHHFKERASETHAVCNWLEKHVNHHVPAKVGIYAHGRRSCHHGKQDGKTKISQAIQMLQMQWGNLANNTMFRYDGKGSAPMRHHGIPWRPHAPDA